MRLLIGALLLPGCSGGTIDKDVSPERPGDSGDSHDPGDSSDSGDGLVASPQRFAGYAYYAGDPHAHTGYSGDASAQDDVACPACGAFEDVFTVSIDAGLSWVALADHVNGYPAASPAGFIDQLRAVLAAHDPEHGFLTLPSAEVWFKAGEHELGHKTLLFFGDNAILSGLSLTDVQPTGTADEDIEECDPIWTWASALEDRFGPLLLIPHHPAGVQPMPTDWTCANADYQPVVEMYSEQGSALDDGSGFDPPWAGTLSRATVEKALDPDGLALKMGFIAGTDSHDTLPGEVCSPDLVHLDQPYAGGLTMVVLPEDTPWSRGSLLGAFQSRSVYATSGPLLPLSVSWVTEDVGLGGLGEDLSLPEGHDLTLMLAVPAEHAATVSTVTAVGPTGSFPASSAAEGVWTVTVPNAEVPAWLYVAVTVDGAAWYAGRSCEDGGDDATEWLWTSPSWITVEGR